MSWLKSFQLAFEVLNHSFAGIDAVIQGLPRDFKVDGISEAMLNQQLLQKVSKLSEIGQEDHHTIHYFWILQISERQRRKRPVDVRKSDVVKLSFSCAVLGKTLSRRNEPPKILGMLRARTRYLDEDRNSRMPSPGLSNHITAPLEPMLQENEASTSQYGKDRAYELKPRRAIGRLHSWNEETKLMPRCSHLNLRSFRGSV